MEAHALPSPAKRLAITITVMAATLMQVLDSTIANVALPHMQATLGATQESVAWVLTSYIIAVAIATPIPRTSFVDVAPAAEPYPTITPAAPVRMRCSAAV